MSNDAKASEETRGRNFTWKQFCEKIDFVPNLTLKRSAHNLMIPDPSGERTIFYKVITNRRDIILQLTGLTPCEMFRLIDGIYRLTQAICGPIYIYGPGPDSRVMVASEAVHAGAQKDEKVLHLS